VSAHHHRVIPGQADSAYELGRLDARRERRDARDQGVPVIHLRVRLPAVWAQQTARYRDSYEAGWTSSL
jgi:hypothetical protein